MLKQFDVVQIITTKRIRFLSGPQGHSTNPQGNWSVVGFIDSDAIIAKESTIVKVPVSDLRKIAGYDLNSITSKIHAAGYLKADKEINMSDHLSKVLNIDIAKARELLLSYNYKTVVKSDQEKDKITKRITEICQKKKKN